MNKKSIVLPLLLGALIAAGPAYALAEDGSSDTSGSDVSVTGSADVSGERGPKGGILKDLLNREDRPLYRNASTNMPLLKEREREHVGSSTRRDLEDREHMGSTTREDRGERKGQAIEKVQSKSSEKIDERIKKLEEQITRIGKMERLSDAQKASITAELEAQVTLLTELKGKIATETSTTTLKELSQSITKSYRVYAVTMPKAAITAASDRIMTVAAQMESFSAKLSARIDAAATAGADVTAARAAFTDYTAKIADAKVQAQAAATAVAGLVADNGDTGAQAANATALKDAKAKIDAAQADLKAARKDIDTMLKAVRGTGEVKAEASTGN